MLLTVELHILKHPWHLGSHLSVPKKLDSNFTPAPLCSNTSVISESPIYEKIPRLFIAD
jgi:hypothetical protein